MVATIRDTHQTIPLRDTRKRGSIAAYSDRKWRKYALAWVQRYPLCVVCVCCGKVNAGVAEHSLSTQRNLIVDHITPHRGDSELYWLDMNHETLCRYPCHDSTKSRHEHKGRSAGQWFDWLAEMIAEYKSWEMVQGYRDLIPSHVMSEIDARMSAIAIVPTTRGGRVPSLEIG